MINQIYELKPLLDCLPQGLEKMVKQSHYRLRAAFSDQHSAAKESFYPSNITAHPNSYRDAVSLTIVSVRAVQSRSRVTESPESIGKPAWSLKICIVRRLKLR